MSTEGERVTTTHAGHGEGRPRLLLAAVQTDGTPSADGGEEFELVRERTVIGSGAEADVRLDGLDGVHAEVQHTEQDEYVLLLHGEGQTSFYENAELPDGKGFTLRTGYRFEIGPHVFSYMREEYADHGRPYGGREGGEFSDQPQQGPRPGDDETTDELSYEVEQAAQPDD